MHLFEMKQIVYDKPYKNDEKAPESKLLTLTGREKVSQKVTISGDDLRELFSMTPYFYSTRNEFKARLDKIDETELTVEFVILCYEKI